MMYAGLSLVSDWPEEFLKKIYRYVIDQGQKKNLRYSFREILFIIMVTVSRKTPAIDPEILRTMKMQGTIGYAPNPQAFRRNQVRKQYSPTLLPFMPQTFLKYQ